MARPDDFSLLRGGPSYRVALRLGFDHPGKSRRLYKVLALIAVTWAPLLLLSLAAGHVSGPEVAVPLLRDPVVFSRFLFALPLLSLAELVVEAGLSIQAHHFVESGIVAERSLPDFQAAKVEAIRRSDSDFAEAAILVLSVVLVYLARVVIGLGPQETSWERTEAAITPAGWWNILVSLPILGFFLLRWAWIFALWAWFLYRVSRLHLELTPTHPDRAGGLGFLGWGTASFALVVMAVSAVISSSFAYEIIHRGSSLQLLKYHLVVFAVMALVIVHVPLVAFTGRLARCRFRGLLDFGMLIGCHDRAFDRRWLRSPGVDRSGLVGSPDASSVADIGSVYEHVERMQLLPVDRKALIVLVVATLLPMVPLLGTVIGPMDIITMLGKFLV